MSAEENRKSKPVEQGQEAAPEAAAGAQPAAEKHSAAETQSAAGAHPAANAQEQLARLAAENAALQDQLLRKAAEFENFRKRMFREREEGVRYANALLLGDLIPIIDDFERALQSAVDSRDFTMFHSGVEMIERQLVSVLERNWGLKRFSPQSGPNGDKFDPEKHEAIAVEDTAAAGDPVVLENYQKGYYLHDRILRPAKVKVSRSAQNATNGKKE
jgi:molecular chaperone GrpE